MKKIFVLHKEDALLQSYEDFLTSMGYEVFATTNYYKFLLYAGEISSDFFIFDADDNLDNNFIKMLKNQSKAKDIPLLLIINKAAKVQIPPEVTHLLLKPFDVTDFIKILHQYEQNPAQNEFFYVENAQKSQDSANILR